MPNKIELTVALPLWRSKNIAWWAAAEKNLSNEDSLWDAYSVNEFWKKIPSKIAILIKNQSTYVK